MNRQTHAGMLLLLLLGWADWASAATSGDPTEAPPAWVAAQPAAPKTAGVEAPEMKMTLTGRSRKLAVIDGEVVRVGDDFRGSKVLAIKADKVVMEDTAKSLVVTPNVEKKPPTLAAAKKKTVVMPAGNVSSKQSGSNP